MSTKYELHEVEIRLKVITVSRPDQDPTQVVRQQIDEILEEEKHNIEYELLQKVTSLEELPAGWHGAIPWPGTTHARASQYVSEKYLEGQGISCEGKS